MQRRAFVIGTLLLCASPALARKQRELPHRIDQVWNAALRMIRVDLQLAVTDRDQEGGYVLFEYVANGKRFPGSIELITQATGARPTTVVVAQVRGQPSYVEVMLLDRLEKKLAEEVGVPPEPPTEAPKPPPVVDAGEPKPSN
ncbi:MAG TPA: hypothetical protein VFX59_07790 [Polyangiales bacterium]|nr:hypothetical protein [Polyangiales bacterium]